MVFLTIYRYQDSASLAQMVLNINSRRRTRRRRKVSREGERTGNIIPASETVLGSRALI